MYRVIVVNVFTFMFKCFIKEKKIIRELQQVSGLFSIRKNMSFFFICRKLMILSTNIAASSHTQTLVKQSFADLLQNRCTFKCFSNFREKTPVLESVFNKDAGNTGVFL